MEEPDLQMDGSSKYSEDVAEDSTHILNEIDSFISGTDILRKSKESSVKSETSGEDPEKAEENKTKVIKSAVNAEDKNEANANSDPEDLNLDLLDEGDEDTEDLSSLDELSTGKWSREGLPEEEIVRPPDCRPPTPPRDIKSFISIISLISISHNIDPSNRTLQRFFNELKMKAEQESRDFDRRRGHGRGGRGERGKRGGGRGRDEEYPNYDKLADRRGGEDRRRNRSQSSSPGRFSPRSQSSRCNDHPDRRGRSRSRDRDLRSSAHDRRPYSARDRRPSSFYDMPVPSASRAQPAYDRPPIYLLSRAPSNLDIPGPAPSRISSTLPTGSAGEAMRAAREQLKLFFPATNDFV